MAHFNRSRMNRFYLVIFISLVFVGCTIPMEVFDQTSSVKNANSIGNFHSTEIFTDRMSDEIWSSEEGDCLVVNQEDNITFSGNGALHVKWDKISRGCPWLGMGFGWDGWAGKNFSKIYENSAIQFKIRTAGEDMKSLPVAFCMEDYGNVQAWAGFSGGMLAADKITKEWSTITIPILSFGWEEFEADITNVKQFMIQFEAAGDVYIDEMKVVPHKGNLRKRAIVNATSNVPEFDLSQLNLSPEAASVIQVGDNLITIQVDDKNLHVKAMIKDDSPLSNAQEGKDIWNGDALEIAFGTNHLAPVRRKTFLASDQQIGIRASDNPMVWNWRTQKPVSEAKVKTVKTTNGYNISATVPLSVFGIENLQSGEVYGLEVAVDQGTLSGRQEQLRWNRPEDGGFYKDPSLWGEMFIQKTN